MVNIEVKTFEEKLSDYKDSSSAREKLAKDVQLYLSFYKDRILDYDVSYNTHTNNEKGLTIGAMVVIRCRQVMKESLV